MKLAQQGRQQGDRVDFLGGDLDGPADIARLGRGGFGEGAGGTLNLFGSFEEVLTARREGIARLAFVEQANAERLLECRDAPRDGGLADPQGPARGQRAAFAGDGEEVAQVVPVEHRPALAPFRRCPCSAILQNDSTNSLLP